MLKKSKTIKAKEIVVNKQNEDSLSTFSEWHKSFHRKDKYADFKNIKQKALLIGCPNVGKSTFFNKVTTSTASVSNIDRMTVDNMVGRVKKHKDCLLVDLPGLYNLSHPIDEELVVAHELCCHDGFNKIVNIIGAQSIQRDLLLTIQAIETGRLSTLIINMIDEVDNKTLNVDKLSKLLNNVKVVQTQANKSKGIKQAIQSLINDNPVKDKLITYSNTTEKAINELSKFILNKSCSKRWISLMILEQNNFVIDFFKTEYGEVYNHIQKVLNKYHDYDFIDDINSKRQAFIDLVINQCLNNSINDKFIDLKKLKQRKFDHIFLNKCLGIPLLFLIIAIVYYVSFGPYAGGGLQKLIADDFLNGIVVDKGLYPLFHDIFYASDWVTNLFTQGMFGGFFTIISFIVPICILFFFVGIIQQTGLISRISVLLDQALNHFGLSGRSVVNLITGFGCNVPSILSARSSNSKKERIISILITPFISCSARAIVYSYICNVIFGVQWGWLALIIMMILSATIALLIGLIFSKTMFRKQKSFFFIEMVNWRRPDFIVIFKSIKLQLKEFIVKAAMIILAANLIIWLLLHIGPNGLLNNSQIDQSLIGYFSKGINYIMYPFGLNDSKGWVGNENGWKMTLSLISALPAKEIALSNISLLFGNESSGFIINQIPIGISYLVIFMLYMPCVATISAMIKEGGIKVLLIHLATSITIAYSLGLISYWISYACVR